MTESGVSCDRCTSPLEGEDLRCPVCNAAAPKTETEDREQTAIEVLRCSGCGAAVSYDVRARAPACAFCGSVTELDRPQDPPERVQFALPFLVEKPEAEMAYRQWLDSLGWFRPGDLKSVSRVESLTPLWWAGWVFDADADVTWAADSNAGTGRADWAPHAGRTALVFDDVVTSASRGLSAEETGYLVPSYDLATAEPAPEDPPPGATVEQFDMKRSSARERVMGFIQRLVGDRLQQGTIPGTRFRNVHAAVVLKGLVTRRFAFPSYVLAYRYRGRLYRAVVSGQDASRLMGTAPYSVAKILAVVFGSLLALTVLIALIASL